MPADKYIEEFIKKRTLKLFLSFLITIFVVPFITYDTGIRCIAPPCTESAARGGLVEFFSKANNFNAYIIDYSLFILAFLILYLLFELIDRFASS